MTDHVIFRYDPGCQPEITFRGVPSGCAGGANTLSEARAAYRTCLSARLHVDRRALPPVVEHIEGLVCGMWVRTKVGAVHRDKSSDRMLLQILLAEQAGLRDEVSRLVSAGAEPVVVLAEPDHALEVLLDQMSSRDVLVVAHSDDNGSVGWGLLYGADSLAVKVFRRFPTMLLLRSPVSHRGIRVGEWCATGPLPGSRHDPVAR